MTLITSGMEEMITNWKVSKLHSESDHKFIAMDMAIPKEETKKRQSKVIKTRLISSLKSKL